MRAVAPICSLLAASFVLGCSHGRPFVNSSLDFNGGQFHEVALHGDVEAVADAVSSIMAERGAVLIKRRGAAVLLREPLVLSFRRALERREGAVATTARKGFGITETQVQDEYVAFGSLFYVQLTAQNSVVSVQAIGLPVIEGHTACPALVERFRVCKPAESASTSSFAENAAEDYGVQVNGAAEGEVLSGLLAELQREKWSDTYSPQE